MLLQGNFYDVKAKKRLEKWGFLKREERFLSLSLSPHQIQSTPDSVQNRSSHTVASGGCYPSYVRSKKTIPRTKGETPLSEDLLSVEWRDSVGLTFESFRNKRDFLVSYIISLFVVLHTWKTTVLKKFQQENRKKNKGYRLILTFDLVFTLLYFRGHGKITLSGCLVESESFFFFN